MIQFGEQQPNRQLQEQLKRQAESIRMRHLVPQSAMAEAELETQSSCRQMATRTAGGHRLLIRTCNKLYCMGADSK